MKKVLFVGQNPLAQFGNSHMLRAILSALDSEKYEATNFVEGIGDIIYQPKYHLINAEDCGDNWGKKKLLRVIAKGKFDVLFMVGIDLWRYSEIFKDIKKLQEHKKFKWAWLFPYDINDLRKDWVKWINQIDYPCVYSKYGEEILKGHVPNLRYFRPPLDNANIFKPYDAETRAAKRLKCFNMKYDRFLFGFVGDNLIRKDPQRLIKAFSLVKKTIPDSVLYLHTDMSRGVFNIFQYLNDLHFKTGDIITKPEGDYTPQQMVDIFNSIDCLVNCSLQEGLSWTLLEAMLCGTPVIASDTTAQTELIARTGFLIPCDELRYVPMQAEYGSTWIEAKGCRVESIASAMIMTAKDEEFRETCIRSGKEFAQEWLNGVSDINALLDEMTKPVFRKPKTKIDKVLFAQFSSAGDVLMTTQCFNGIKERHPRKKLVYMTYPTFKGIIEGNPYVDEILDWDDEHLSEYEVLYNPHGQKILPGGFNSLDVKLADMYPYFTKVKADKMFIKEIKPDIDLPEKYIIVHTTGGSPYRIYAHMEMVVNKLDIPVIQIGSAGDMVCPSAIDLRGKLSWNETAWVMKRAKAAVVVDSFPAHLAGALGTPVVVLFGPAPARVTGPIGDQSKIICLEANKLDVCKHLTNCYGEIGCGSPCINTINPLTVKKALQSLMNGKE